MPGDQQPQHHEQRDLGEPGDAFEEVLGTSGFLVTYLAAVVTGAAQYHARQQVEQLRQTEDREAARLIVDGYAGDRGVAQGSNQGQSGDREGSPRLRSWAGWVPRRTQRFIAGTYRHQLVARPAYHRLFIFCLRTEPLAALSDSSGRREGGWHVNAERAEKRARAIYEAALFSTLMQQESEAAAASEDEFDFDVTLRETLVRMISKELLVEPSTVVRSAARRAENGFRETREEAASSVPQTP